MKRHTVRFTEEAEQDLQELYGWLCDRCPDNLQIAERALDAIIRAIDMLRTFPWNCRKATAHDPYLRELIIPFGSSGYVALYRIEPDNIVTILAVRHQREEDYH
ncbi:type II toxin-antitoxin system RelE/ParE family toxin [Lautropia mirabilis]